MEPQSSSNGSGHCLTSRSVGRVAVLVALIGSGLAVGFFVRGPDSAGPAVSAQAGRGVPTPEPGAVSAVLSSDVLDAVEAAAEPVRPLSEAEAQAYRDRYAAGIRRAEAFLRAEGASGLDAVAEEPRP